MRTPAEAFPVSEYIREEMDEREWSVEKLADKCVLPVAELAGILDGSKPFLVHHAERIGVAFGTSASVWINLNRAYKEFQRRAKPSPAPARSKE